MQYQKGCRKEPVRALEWHPRRCTARQVRAHTRGLPPVRASHPRRDSLEHIERATQRWGNTRVQSVQQSSVRWQRDLRMTGREGLLGRGGAGLERGGERIGTGGIGGAVHEKALHRSPAEALRSIVNCDSVLLNATSPHK